jgi:hypothetical protein
MQDINIANKAYLALNTFAATLQEGVTRLRQAFVSLGIGTVEDAEPIVTSWAAQRHNCPLVEGRGKAKGRMVLDSSAPSYEAAKTTRRRAMDALTGDADADVSAKGERAAEEIEIPAELLAAAAKLAKLAQEYEGARKLASKALAQAFAK